MPWSRRRKIVVAACATLCGALLALVVLFLWACGGIQSPGTSEGPTYDFGTGSQPQLQPQTANKLVVLTWNIAFAYGYGSGTTDYAPRTAEEMADRLKSIGEAVRDSGADVVLLQEIDFDSARSHYTDQLEELSRITGLRYAARAVSWKAGYVPWPTWSPRRHFGAISSGGAVLSRYPITANRVTLHPKPGRYSWLHDAFYLFRYSQYVQLQWGDRNVAVLNNHLEGFDAVNRAEQARALSDLVPALAEANSLVIVGGDLNTLPSGAAVQHAFPDEPDADLGGDETMGELRGMPGLTEVVSMESYLKDERAFFTFPAHAPNRRIDYLFVSDGASIESARVLPVGELSDHLPVRAELHYGPPPNGRGPKPERSTVVEEDEVNPVTKAVNTVILTAVREKATEARLVPSEKGLEWRLKVDGKWRELTPFPKIMIRPIVARFKAVAGLDRAEKREPQEATITITFTDDPYRLKVKTTVGNGGRAGGAGEGVTILFEKAEPE